MPSCRSEYCIFSRVPNEVCENNLNVIITSRKMFSYWQLEAFNGPNIIASILLTEITAHVIAASTRSAMIRDFLSLLLSSIILGTVSLCRHSLDCLTLLTKTMLLS